MEPQIKYVQTKDGGSIAYATLGEGKPLVLLTPWASSFEQDWEHPDGRDYISELARERMLVLFDRSGVGGSQREVDDVSLEKQLLDFGVVLDALQLERFDLIGEEDGGTIAVAYAAQNPERVSKLVLFWPIIAGEDVSSPDAARSLADLMRTNWSLARRAMADAVFPTGPLELQKWARNYWRQAVSAEVAAKYLEWYMTEDVREFAARVGAPTLILCRRGQRHIPIQASRTAAALIPNAKLVVLDGDRGIVYTDPAPSLERVRQFLDDDGSVTRSAPQSTTATVHAILFTDIVGHTEMMSRLGDERGREVLREHERITRVALAEYSGDEIKTMGDGFMASFGSVTRAMDCAIALQQAFADHNAASPEPLHVRVGLNAGEPIEEEGDLFGSTVIMASRIAAKANAGEILIPEPLRHLLTGKSYVYADRGETMLKGFEDSVRLFEVRWSREE